MLWMVLNVHMLNLKNGVACRDTGQESIHEGLGKRSLNFPRSCITSEQVGKVILIAARTCNPLEMHVKGLEECASYIAMECDTLRKIKEMLWCTRSVNCTADLETTFKLNWWAGEYDRISTNRARDFIHFHHANFYSQHLLNNSQLFQEY